MSRSVRRTRMPLRRKLALAVIAVLGIIAIYYALSALLASPLTEPQVIAHRGGRVSEPENTLAAFSRAITDGTDWLEFDVQMSKDGSLVVIHDTTVDRTTNGSGLVADLTLAELQRLDAGRGEHIPTFAEVIGLAKKAKVNILPEAKSPKLYPGIEQAMIDMINEAGYADHTVIQSFDSGALETLHRLDPAMRLCALYGQGDLRIPEPPPGNAEFLCPMAEMVAINPAMIRDAHDHGRQVFVWFGKFEGPTMMRAMLEAGADGLIVDDPVALERVLGR